MTGEPPAWCVLAHSWFQHHGSRSGYTRLQDHLPEQWERRHVREPKVPPRLRRSAIQLATWRAIRSCTSDRILHLYAEQTATRRVMTAGTHVTVAHQPPSVIGNHSSWARTHRDALHAADCVVALAPEQADYLRTINERTILVPHGVDTEWFKTADPQEPFAVSVHGWLRDRSRQLSVESALERRGLRVHRVNDGGPRLADATYRDLLAAATCVIVVIPDAVASNAVVEAASAGCCVVGELSLDARWYLSEQNAALLAEPTDTQLDAIADFSDIGATNRVQAVRKYDWRDVGSSMTHLLKNLL